MQNKLVVLFVIYLEALVLEFLLLLPEDFIFNGDELSVNLHDSLEDLVYVLSSQFRLAAARRELKMRSADALLGHLDLHLCCSIKVFDFMAILQMAIMRLDLQIQACNGGLAEPVSLTLLQNMRNHFPALLGELDVHLVFQFFRALHSIFLQ